MKYTSPLRYPGGKAGLTGFIAVVIELNELHGCRYFEPFAGGAGAALNLLRQNIVSELYLNDADRRVYAFWHSVLHFGDRFVDKVFSIPLTIDEWNQQRSICANPRSYPQFDVGFAAFYMNRCNRSGVLTGSGPIGGYEQSGTWRMDVRFNRSALAERILGLLRMKRRIHVSCEDALIFLKKRLPLGLERSRAFVYLDPPYVNNGQRLYLNAYNPGDHNKLARYLDAQRILPWIMSYDDNDFIRDLYAESRVALMPIRYSLQTKRAARELVISPNYLAVPQMYRAKGEKRLLQFGCRRERSA